MPVIVILCDLMVYKLSTVFILAHGGGASLTSCAYLLCSSLAFTLFDVRFVSDAVFSVTNLLLLLCVVSTDRRLTFVSRLAKVPKHQTLRSRVGRLKHHCAVTVLSISRFGGFGSACNRSANSSMLGLITDVVTRANNGTGMCHCNNRRFAMLFGNGATRRDLRCLRRLHRSVTSCSLVVESGAAQPGSTGRNRTGHNGRGGTGIIGIAVDVKITSGARFGGPRRIVGTSSITLCQTGSKNHGYIDLWVGGARGASVSLVSIFLCLGGGPLTCRHRRYSARIAGECVFYWFFEWAEVHLYF